MHNNRETIMKTNYMRGYYQSLTCLALFQAVGEMAWQLPRDQTVASATRKCATPIKFQIKLHE